METHVGTAITSLVMKHGGMCNMNHLDDLTPLQKEVAQTIIDVVVDNRKIGVYHFHLNDLYNRRQRIQQYSNAEDIKATIRGIVNKLRHEHRQIYRDEQNPGFYEITEGSLFFYIIRERRLIRMVQGLGPTFNTIDNCI